MAIFEVPIFLLLDRYLKKNIHTMLTVLAVVAGIYGVAVVSHVDGYGALADYCLAGYPWYYLRYLLLCGDEFDLIVRASIAKGVRSIYLHIGVEWDLGNHRWLLGQSISTILWLSIDLSGRHDVSIHRYDQLHLDEV